MKHSSEVSKMIVRVMKKKDCKEPEAIEYMLAVATGRLAALWRYDNSLPDGKSSKGVRVPGKKKAAVRVKPIMTALHTEAKA